jgi:zinc protease
VQIVDHHCKQARAAQDVAESTVDRSSIYRATTALEAQRMTTSIRIGALALAILAAGIYLTPPVSAQTTGSAPPKPKIPVPAMQQVASVEGITEHRLANGLRVLLFPDQSKPTIVVNVTYLVGSRHEGYGETGMAHLLEHMLFKGTTRQNNISAEFNRRGMRFNGTTSFDRTNYFELFQASDDNLEWALQMEADRMVNSRVDRADLDTEMTVVRNEYESGENSPFGVLIKRMQSVAFDWHNYGNSAIGNRSDIENVGIDNLRAFYRRYYQPDNAVLLIAGKFEESTALRMVGKHFGTIPRPKRTLPTLWTVEPTQDGERSFVVRRNGDVQIVALGYRVPSSLHPDAQAVRLLNTLLTDAPSGRLHKALVETGKAVQVLGIPLLGVDTGLQVFGAVVKNGEPTEPVKLEMARIIEELQSNPPTDAELARAQTAVANSMERALNNPETSGLQMSEYIARGDWRLFFVERDRVAGLKSGMLTAAAGKYYRRDNRTAGVFQPENEPRRAEIPAAPALADALKDFKSRSTSFASEQFDPSQENIDKRTKRLEIDGVKVALLRKSNRGETVVFSMRLHTGDEKSLFGQQTVSRLTGQMLMRGNSRFNREQLKDEFEKLKVSGGVSGLNAEFQTTKANLSAAIRLTAQTLREPTFPEAEFEQLKKQSLTSIESQRSDPSALAASELAAHFNLYPKGDFRYSATLDEELADLNAASLQNVKDFHKKFYGSNRGEIAVIGDFDEEEVLKAIREAFAGWKSTAPYERLKNQYQAVTAVNRVIQTPDKENAVFRARINVEMGEDDAEYPALFVANHILGGGAGFDSRLTKRIRVRDGLSYGVGSNLSVGSIDRAGAWNVSAIAAPQNIAKVEAAFKDELAKALKDGFTNEELTAAKSGIQQQRVQNRSQDRALAVSWTNNLFLDRTFAWSKQFEDRLAALKLADVNAAIKKYFDPAKITFVKAGDFTRTEAKSASSSAN